MQNIENDMDELFRRAVDNTSLIPPYGRWDEVAGKIVQGKTNQFKKISGTFGFLFSGAIVLTILTTFITKQEINTEGLSSAPSGNSTTEKIINTNDKNGNNSSTLNNIPQNKKFSIITNLIKENKSNFPPLPFNVIEGKQSGDLLLREKNEENAYNTIRSSDKPIGDVQIVNVNSPTAFESGLYPIAFENLLQNHPSIELNGNIKDSHPSTQVNLNSFNNSRFYLGLTGGPLISKIKSQGLKKPGFDMGLLVGYRISKKLSVETGLLYTKQYYFSGGKYYNTATGGNTASSMEGSRSAFEIPFKLNYYVLRNKSGSFYVSGGLSSFVGVNDKIVVNVGENPQHPTQKLDYGVASYLPSYLNIGLGYDYKSGKSTHFRIEPYLQIPMSSTAGNTININAGDALQVYNTGLHIIISEFIH